MPRIPYTQRLPGPGKITLTVAETAIARGHAGKHQFANKASLRTLQRGTGLAYGTLYWMLRRPDHVQYLTFETLTRLCAFLDCQPGDLMRYDPTAPDLPSLSVMLGYRPLEEFDGNL